MQPINIYVHLGPSCAARPTVAAATRPQRQVHAQLNAKSNRNRIVDLLLVCSQVSPVKLHHPIAHDLHDQEDFCVFLNFSVFANLLPVDLHDESALILRNAYAFLSCNPDLICLFFFVRGAVQADAAITGTPHVEIQQQQQHASQ